MARPEAVQRRYRVFKGEQWPGADHWVCSLCTIQAGQDVPHAEGKQDDNRQFLDMYARRSLLLKGRYAHGSVCSLSVSFGSAFGVSVRCSLCASSHALGNCLGAKDRGHGEEGGVGSLCAGHPGLIPCEARVKAVRASGLRWTLTTLFLVVFIWSSLSCVFRHSCHACMLFPPEERGGHACSLSVRRKRKDESTPGRMFPAARRAACSAPDTTIRRAPTFSPGALFCCSGTGRPGAVSSTISISNAWDLCFSPFRPA